ncbi:hypothetical protein RHGRI_033287 [Rhododendron griersonianum]|uniref:Uncharacterized protein n=1 Tax=Rhododendron griersonianum TaxID=479676 RepID=A0AAV6I1P2_9ERIC|nr:hypothetical protein RHGRI_033287 [Rhododendron griersonianum]
MGKTLNDWAIKVEDELKLMTTAETAEMQQRNKQSIYKLPKCFTDLNKKAYMPQFVSFGPYHYWDPHLRAMEKHKRRALLHFLKMSPKPLASYIAALAKVAPNLKDSYGSHNYFWERDTDEFLKMMILDGCFMLEVLRTWTSQRTHDYSYSDLIFSEHGKLHVVPYIRRDMMMLENQLPMLLLTTLLAVENEETQIIRSAMELSDAGIRFKKSRSASLNDISFTGGVLSLPPIVVDDTTESTFLNLIAFERFHVNFAGSEVTSYIFFMSKIIESAEDVSLLRARGIIENALGSDNDVSILFNSLSKDVTLDQDTSLYGLHGEVNRYWKERRVRVYLMKNYFRNPWAMLSLIGAVFLFFFMIAQAAYTIISYHDPAKN